MTRHETDAAAPTPRFIVGMPRAATTWLCKCFNERPDTAAFGESMFWGRRYVKPAAGDRYTAAQLAAILNRLCDGACLQSVRGEGPGTLKYVTKQNLRQVLEPAFAELDPNPTPAATFAKLCEAIARAEGKSAAVEKTPHHLNWIDRIIGAFPDARIVILLREPYGFMLSYKHQGDRKSPELRRQLKRLYHPLGCSLIWRASMRSALAAKRQYPNQVMFVQQSDVRRDPAGVLDSVQRFFELEPIDLAATVPADNTSFPGGARPELKSEDVFWMNLVAGGTVDQAGYERQRLALRPLRILWSVLRIPIWAVHCVLTLRTRVEGSLAGYVMRWFRPQQSRRASPASSS